MQSSENKSYIAEFLQFIATKKNEWEDWEFCHLGIGDPNGSVLLGEVEQFMQYHIKSDNVWQMKIAKSNELILFSKNNEQEFRQFEQELAENFEGDNVLYTYRNMDKHGVTSLAKIIEPKIEADDLAGKIALTRMCRWSNSIIVLDDDQMVLRQMEKVLAGYGNVVTIKDPKDFKEMYRQYAPDILFLDIHLGSARGNHILKTLKREIDPFAHVVMISSDTKEDMVMDVKDGGANGFVVKPINRDKVHQHVLKAPTITTKENS